jgi:hypothetical protein
LYRSVPQTDLAELAEHKYGYRVLVQLLHPYGPRCLPPQLLALARPAPKEYSAEAMQRGAAAGPDQQQQQQQQENGAGGDAASDSDDEQVLAGPALLCTPVLFLFPLKGVVLASALLCGG